MTSSPCIPYRVCRERMSIYEPAGLAVFPNVSVKTEPSVVVAKGKSRKFAVSSSLTEQFFASPRFVNTAKLAVERSQIAFVLPRIEVELAAKLTPRYVYDAVSTGQFHFAAFEFQQFGVFDSIDATDKTYARRRPQPAIAPEMAAQRTRIAIALTFDCTGFSQINSIPF